MYFSKSDTYEAQEENEWAEYVIVLFEVQKFSQLEERILTLTGDDK